jgi:hypothetical protein
MSHQDANRNAVWAIGAAHLVEGDGRSFHIRLNGSDYQGLRDYCHHQQKATGRRITFEDVMVEALQRLLKAEREKSRSAGGTGQHR